MSNLWFTFRYMYMQGNTKRGKKNQGLHDNKKVWQASDNS